MLLEEALGEPVPQARIRYHVENVTALVDVNDAARNDLRLAIARANELRQTTARPPVASNEHLCRRCSLTPVCLPEEERLGAECHGHDDVEETSATPTVPTLFPSNRERQTLHVMSPKAQLGRSGETLLLNAENDQHQKVTRRIPIEDVDAVVVHGFGQVTTQAIHMCASHGIAVQWMTAGGRFAAGTANSPGRVQQRLRQYAGLSDPATRLRLARQLVHAKVETQLRYLLRATRRDEASRRQCLPHLERIRETLRRIVDVESEPSLLGLEGMAAKAWSAESIIR